MTDEEINNAIAEYLGTARVDTFPPLTDARLEPKQVRVERPRYCSDLNAMHESECGLMASQWFVYRAHLGWPTDFLCVHRNARQRAEAFLRTIGKWRE